MIKIIEKLKALFKDIDKKDLKIMRNGLKFCFFILIISISILFTYLFFINDFFVYQVGIMMFQLSLYFGIDFIVAGLVVDTIQKQIM